MVSVQTKFQAINEYKQGHTAVELAEKYEVSLRSIFGWLKRFDGSIESLSDARAKNRRERLKVTRPVEELLLKLRTEEMGYKRISWRLKRKHGVKITPTTVKRWLKKHGLSGYKKKRKWRRRPDRTKKMFNQLWRLDIKEFRIKGVGKTYDYVGIDDCTRTLFAYAYKHKNSDNAIDFVKRVIKKHGKPDEIRVDNGTQFVYLLKRKYKNTSCERKCADAPTSSATSVKSKESNYPSFLSGSKQKCKNRAGNKVSERGTHQATKIQEPRRFQQKTNRLPHFL